MSQPKIDVAALDGLRDGIDQRVDVEAFGQAGFRERGQFVRQVGLVADDGHAELRSLADDGLRRPQSSRGTADHYHVRVGNTHGFQASVTTLVAQMVPAESRASAPRASPSRPGTMVKVCARVMGETSR